MTHPYAGAAYAAGLPHLGEPCHVPEWGLHMLMRPVPQGRASDAAGPYPLAVLGANADLRAGLERLKGLNAVSATLVLDPVRRPAEDRLRAVFQLVRPFKTHHLHDARLGPPRLSKHHRYEVRRARAAVRVEEFSLAERRGAWKTLYADLARRRGFQGAHLLPDAHLEALEKLPGLRAFGAFAEDRLVSAHLFLTHEGYAVSHLAASNEEGYGAGAAYAVNEDALQRLGCDLVNLGGGAGAADDPSDGLVRFKKGFANRTAAAYLCGAVLRPDLYEACKGPGSASAYFPAYRDPAREDLQ